MAVPMRELRDLSQPIVSEIFGDDAPRVTLGCDHVYDTIVAIADGNAFIVFRRDDIGDNWTAVMKERLAAVHGNMARGILA